MFVSLLWQREHLWDDLNSSILWYFTLQLCCNSCFIAFIGPLVRLEIQLFAPPFQSPKPTTLISSGGAIRLQMCFTAFCFLVYLKNLILRYPFSALCSNKDDRWCKYDLTYFKYVETSIVSIIFSFLYGFQLYDFPRTCVVSKYSRSYFFSRCSSRRIEEPIHPFFSRPRVIAFLSLLSSLVSGSERAKGET